MSQKEYAGLPPGSTASEKRMAKYKEERRRQVILYYLDLQYTLAMWINGAICLVINIRTVRKKCDKQNLLNFWWKKVNHKKCFDLNDLIYYLFWIIHKGYCPKFIKICQKNWSTFFILNYTQRLLSKMYENLTKNWNTFLKITFHTKICGYFVCLFFYRRSLDRIFNALCVSKPMKNW